MSDVKIKKRNIIIFIFVWSIIWAFILDIKNLVSFYLIAKWNIQYSQKNFTWAEDSYNKALPYTDNRNIISNDLWNVLYKKKNYKDAVLNYSKMTETTDENIFNKSHNLWNAFYKLWEEEKDDNKKVSLWKNSVSFYKKALILNVNIDKEETNKNYLFVLDKLKKLEEEIKKKEEEKKKQEEEKRKEEEKKQELKNQSGSGSENEKNWWKEWEWKETSQSGSNNWQAQNSVGWKTWTNQWTWFSSLWGSGSDSEKLTEGEKKELEQYMQYLKDFNQQNQQFLRNGTTKPNTMDDMINNFFWNDQFFNQIIPDNSGNKRDW